MDPPHEHCEDPCTDQDPCYSLRKKHVLVTTVVAVEEVLTSTGNFQIAFPCDSAYCSISTSQFSRSQQHNTCWNFAHAVPDYCAFYELKKKFFLLSIQITK